MTSPSSALARSNISPTKPEYFIEVGIGLFILKDLPARGTARKTGTLRGQTCSYASNLMHRTVADDESAGSRGRGAGARDRVRPGAVRRGCFCMPDEQESRNLQ